METVNDHRLLLKDIETRLNQIEARRHGLNMAMSKLARHLNFLTKGVRDGVYFISVVVCILLSSVSCCRLYLVHL